MIQSIVTQDGTKYVKSTIGRVKRWGDPLIGSTADIQSSNFQAVKLATVMGNGKWDFGDVHKFQTVDINLLRSLQHGNDGYTVQQKMNWLGAGDELVGVPGRPYWIRDGVCEFGTIVFGGQFVKYDPTPIIRLGRYRNANSDELITCFRLIGMKRSDFGMYAYKTHPFFVQRCTAANRTPVENSYDDLPKGEILHPVWDATDFPVNIGNGNLYIAEAFLE